MPIDSRALSGSRPSGPVGRIFDLHRLPAPARVLFGTQFGLFYAGNGLSLIGTWMQRIACSWLVWDWTHSAFWVGVLAAGDLLPVVIIGPFAGVAADRWDRLRQNTLVQLASVLLAVLMAVLMASDRLGLVGVVLLITVQGALTASIQPARLAMVQQMVPREDLATAVALNSVNVNLARLLGPAAAGAMILYTNVTWIFVANAAVTFLFVLILARLRVEPQKKRSYFGSFLGEMLEGFAHVLRVPAIRLILLVMLCGGSMVRAVLELMPPIAANAFDDDATGLAVLTGAAAVGAVTAALTVGRHKAARLLAGVMIWWGLGAAGAILFTRAGSPVLASVAAMLVGAMVTRSLVSTQTFIQITTPDELRGRVLSVHGLIARGSPALGALVIGFAADRLGLALAVTVSSGAMILILLLLLPLVRSAAPGVAETT